MSKFISCEKIDLCNIDRDLMSRGITEHLRERNKRVKRALEIDCGAEFVGAFIVDRGHKNGREIHVISENGIIWVFNESKYKRGEKALITVLIGRPNQVKRYWDMCGECVSVELERVLDKCVKWVRLGWNV